MSTEIPEMDTVLDTVNKLRAQGFTADFSASPHGQLLCDDCGSTFDPATADIEQVHRFEGLSNPADESILYAARADCGHRGIYTAAYGPDTPPHDAVVMRQLRLRGAR
jgi:hypothetical protein